MHLDDPLTDDEFDELDDFLLSDRCADDAMTMDTLHGYLTALAIGPLEMPMAAWLPRVWGGDADGDAGGDAGGNPAAAPRFASEKEQRRIVGLIARFMNEITITFEAAPKEFEPLFCEEQIESGEKFLDAEGWAAGFWEGMQLCADAWEPVWSSDLAPLMQPFYLLGADEIEEADLAGIDDPARRHKLAIEIESAVPLLFRFWQPRRRSATPTVQREAPKTGRNDPCPCGSGKKFKKCCGEPPHQG